MKLKDLIIHLALAISVLALSVNYIYMQHLTRKKFAELQTYINEENELNTEWGKLQIEHSTKIANPAIEAKAKTVLQMFVPQNKETVKLNR